MNNFFPYFLARHHHPFIFFSCIFTAWIFAMGCRDADSSQAVSGLHRKSLSAIDTLYIPIDERVAFDADANYVWLNQKPYLYTYLKQNGQNTLIFYDLQTRQYAFEFSMPQKGPQGIGTSAHIPLVVNLDSIFFIRRHSNRLYLLDSAAQIKGQWEIDQTQTGQEIYRIHAEKRMPMLFRNAQIYCCHRTALLNETAEYYTKPIEVVVQLDNTNSRSYQARLRGSYPGFLQQGVLKGGKLAHQVSRTLDPKGNSIYSFHFDHHLYQTTEGAEQKAYSLPSQYLPDHFPHPPKGIEDNFEMSIQYGCEYGMYFSLIYDPFRRVYYRTVLHPIGPVDIADINMSLFWDLPFSIQIISEEFKLLEEVAFPAKTFNYFLSFIPTPEGLLLPYMHEQLPDLQEDRFAYVLYELVDQ